MEATVEWKGEGLEFVGHVPSGHDIDFSGDSNAISPMESVLAAVGACSAIDVVMILKKGRQDITDCRCELKAERAEDAPRVFTAIHAHYVVVGRDLNDKQVARAVNLSAEKYCSVSLMLGKALPVTHSYETQKTDP